MGIPVCARTVHLCVVHLVEILFFYTGKSGVVAQRLAASLSSVGVAAGFVHGAEWGHGDLGGCGVCVYSR